MPVTSETFHTIFSAWWGLEVPFPRPLAPQDGDPRNSGGFPVPPGQQTQTTDTGCLESFWRYALHPDPPAHLGNQ